MREKCIEGEGNGNDYDGQLICSNPYCESNWVTDSDDTKTICPICGYELKCAMFDDNVGCGIHEEIHCTNPDCIRQ